MILLLGLVIIYYLWIQLHLLYTLLVFPLHHNIWILGPIVCIFIFIIGVLSIRIIIITILRSLSKNLFWSSKVLVSIIVWVLGCGGWVIILIFFGGVIDLNGTVFIRCFKDILLWVWCCGHRGRSFWWIPSLKFEFTALGGS